ncbi:sigma-E processing peptidase SpoIIGA [Niallia circulans]|uniref:Peptidase n=1 Tax=Niallia circulans TaxID=1397 RepID=A0A0J1LGJ6_NIACI|nr:sigma-E processing peptidase SpoIIGA [Niallia circulans]KLV28215.1 peptidase [Niallia circulans]MCM2979698.1 sigma-E processing peptidase SpoIIGA [Niallia circulans]MDR4315688.1 sigma-E processing peptidase SpoIIGA [Niallia circulans]MED3837066.1 sigma-E processing peptidase SpoIIGA [Niallia circulans]MED4244136.1 sigma-E processing peptidase SpoIIGA [Niallia circulans]
MAIYLDVIWLLNLLFDSLLLYLTGILLKKKIIHWRILLGGLIGSLIILFSITPLSPYSNHPISKLLFSIVMVATAFGYKRFRTYIQALMIFYLATFLIGGTLIGAHYFIQFDFDLSSSVLLASIKGFGDPISWLFVLLGFPIVWYFSRRNLEGMEVTKIQYEQIIDVIFQIGGKEFSIKGLVDSGNQVYDPISRLPVMFVSLKNIEKDMPAEIIRLTEQPEAIIYGSQPIAPEWESKMRIIPYKVVGKDHQLLIAVKPDTLFLKKEQEVIVVEKGLISFTSQVLSAEGIFDCIVHPKMLLGKKSIEEKVS